MNDLQKEFATCYEYAASTNSEAAWRVLFDLKAELESNNIPVPVIERKREKEVTADDLRQDEVFMLALMTALAEDDDLWCKYQFVNPDETMMEFYNEKYNDKKEIV